MWQSLAFLKGLDYTWPGQLSTVFKVSETAGGGLSFLSMDCLMGLISKYPPVYASAVTEIVLGVFCLSTCMVVLYCYYPKEEEEVEDKNVSTDNRNTQSSQEGSHVGTEAVVAETPSLDFLEADTPDDLFTRRMIIAAVS